MHTNIFPSGERMLLDFDTRDVGLSMAYGVTRKIKMFIQQGFRSKSLA